MSCPRAWWKAGSARPGSVQADCVQSNLTLWWQAEPTLEPPLSLCSHPPRPGLTLQLLEPQAVDGPAVVSSDLLDFVVVLKASQEIFWGSRSPRRIASIPAHCHLLLLERYKWFFSLSAYYRCSRLCDPSGPLPISGSFSPGQSKGSY